MDPQTRQDYVRAAVSFLQNPKLIDSSLQDKLKFLRDKGLSDIEVDEALNLALVNRHQSQSGRWNFLLILGLCVGGYKLYQAYLESKAQQIDQHKKKATKSDVGVAPEGTSPWCNNTQSNLERAMSDAQTPTLSKILEQMVELKKLIEFQRSNFGAEIQSLKTLLMGHEKFAAPPKIPEWQLADPVEEEKDAVPTEKLKSGEKQKKKKNTQVQHSSERDCDVYISEEPILG